MPLKVAFLKWGCDPSLLRVVQLLRGGTSYRVRVHGGLSKAFVRTWAQRRLSSGPGLV